MSKYHEAEAPSLLSAISDPALFRCSSDKIKKADCIIFSLIPNFLWDREYGMVNRKLLIPSHHAVALANVYQHRHHERITGLE